MDEQVEMKVLIFGLNDEYYAANIDDVERILRFKNATPMPDAPDFVEGVINYEDVVLPVINIKKKFKLTEIRNTEEPKVISMKIGDKKLGIIVDSVCEVSNIAKNKYEETPDITKNSTNNYIKGLIKLEDKIIILINIDNILSKQEEELIY